MSNLTDIHSIILSSLQQTALAPLVGELRDMLCGGKMLRAQLILSLAPATALDSDKANNCGAVVEMLHAASLLHDDVIDNAQIRRGLPTFWREHGASAAVLLGDVLVCQAISLVDSHLRDPLLKLLSEICEAELEQELLLKNQPANWDAAVSIARRKTGPLFAFSGIACGQVNEQLRTALCEVGYLLGTAYQLADDFLDVYGTEDVTGKTLGTDLLSKKITAATAWQASTVNPQQEILDLCEKALAEIVQFSQVRSALAKYMDQFFMPAINRCFPVDVT